MMPRGTSATHWTVHAIRGTGHRPPAPGHPEAGAATLPGREGTGPDPDAVDDLAQEALARHAGQRATFTGRLVPNPPGFAQRVGMVLGEGAALARRQGDHIEVAYADITLEP